MCTFQGKENDYVWEYEEGFSEEVIYELGLKDAWKFIRWTEALEERAFQMEGISICNVWDYVYKLSATMVLRLRRGD